MATILKSKNCKRSTIRLSTNDIISVVRDYQQLIKKYRYIDEIKDVLSNHVLFLPEDI
jgi:hypothetical protein